MRWNPLFWTSMSLIAMPLSALAQDWGDLQVTFIYDGEPPALHACEVTKDADFCGQFALVQEELTINPENRGIANVVAYLYLRRGDAAPKTHPSYAATATDEVLLDNNHCRFDPHVTLLRTSQTLVVGNSDDVGHNCKIDTLVNPAINFTIPTHGKMYHKFPEAERLPSRVTCSIHPWMGGWLLVKDNPYMAISDKNGKLLIKNLPVGTWTIQFWHEKSGYVDTVVQNGKPTEWRRGRVEVEIGPGSNDLGTVKLAPTLFADE